MAHNIEERNGIASFAENGRKERAWHRLGKVFDRPMTVKEALEASHADYRVEKRQLITLTPYISEAMATGSVPTDMILDALIHGKQATMRDDTMETLGIVSDSYGIVQNLDAFTFIDTLCTGGLSDRPPVIECAGVLGKGERIFITAKFPDDIILDNKGDDKVEMYIVFTTSHDGTGSVKCLVTPTRVVCNNTLNVALANNKGCLSLRHSSKVMERLDLASRENTEFAFKALDLMRVYRNSLEERLTRLRNITLSERDLDRILAEVALADADLEEFGKHGIESLDISTRSRNVFYGMKNAVENGVGQEYGERGTALWAVNGLTSYFQNHVEYKSDETKLDSVLNGNVKNKILAACEAIGV